MRFTGTSAVSLPKVSNFSFALTGIRLSDTGVVSFTFSDTGSNSFAFTFSGGLIQTDRTMGTYNTVDSTTIKGYLQSGVLNYKINGIYNQKNITFSGLDKLTVNAGNSTGNLDVLVTSNPINYNVSFSPSYIFGQTLFGTITSDTAFNIQDSSLFFYNSNFPLLGNSGYATGLNVTSGNTTLSLFDEDVSVGEYSIPFYMSLPTTFGDIGGVFSTDRTGVSNSTILSFADSSGNAYYQTSLFNGIWTGNTFTYEDNVLSYNLSFNYGSTYFIGDDALATLSIAFQPLSPTGGGNYTRGYITGFNLISGGGYSITPTFSGAQYYYVTGLQQALTSFLFSSGCAQSLGVTFSGGNPTSGASGALILKPIRVSGIYGPGINTFQLVSGYSGANAGLGYQSAPRYVLATGGSCYSLPDVSGGSSGQFLVASGYGAVYAQAAGLTGSVLMTGTGVSGVEVGNIGFGYNATYPPIINFIRNTGDTGHFNASGTFGLNNSGSYVFNDFWTVNTNFGGGNTSPLSGYNGYYSGNFNVSGNGNFLVQLICSGLDNTAPVSGMLTLILSGNGFAITGNKIISQSRMFSSSPTFLIPPPVPTSSVQPLPDLSYAFNADQLESQYENDLGLGNNIIQF